MAIRNLLLLLLLVVAFGNAHNYVDDKINAAIVPEPTDGGRWWYTPSRKAHLYRHRYPSADSIVKKGMLQGMKANEDLRLSGDLRPVSYNVRLLPFIEEGNFTVDGFVEIIFNCIRSTSNITLNSNELTIDRNSIGVIYFLIHFDKMCF